MSCSSFVQVCLEFALFLIDLPLNEFKRVKALLWALLNRWLHNIINLFGVSNLYRKHVISACVNGSWVFPLLTTFPISFLLISSKWFTIIYWLNAALNPFCGIWHMNVATYKLYVWERFCVIKWHGSHR